MINYWLLDNIFTSSWMLILDFCYYYYERELILFVEIFLLRISIISSKYSLFFETSLSITYKYCLFIDNNCS